MVYNVDICTIYLMVMMGVVVLVMLLIIMVMILTMIMVMAMVTMMTVFLKTHHEYVLRLTAPSGPG